MCGGNAISQNLEDLKEKILAVQKNKDHAITIIAVSKKKSGPDIEEAFRAGQKDFAENYVQEFLEKHEKTKHLPLRWHFIGHLQSNKVKFLIGKIFLLHTLDRPSLAKELQKQCEKQNVVQNCLIQVKISTDQTKEGCLPSEVFEFAKFCKHCTRLKILGLTGVASLTENQNQIRNEFFSLRKIKDHINAENIFKTPLTELSMGMSADFPLAIAEGATMIRIGTKIFGERVS